MSKLIYASNGIHSLLRNGEVLAIGKVHVLTKRLLSNGRMVPIRMIEFDWDCNDELDHFFFENGVYVFHSVSLTRQGYMLGVYREFLAQGNLDLYELIKVAVNAFVTKEMGF